MSQKPLWRELAWVTLLFVLGYKFEHADYVGRGVIEAIGIGIDIKDGDLALRGNYST